MFKNGTRGLLLVAIGFACLVGCSGSSADVDNSKLPAGAGVAANPTGKPQDQQQQKLADAHAASGAHADSMAAQAAAGFRNSGH